MSESIASYVETRKRRIHREAAARDARIKEARIEIRELVEDFRRIDPEIRSITLFGSLATGRVRSRWFDIDVVEIRTCMEGLLRAIERDGEVLYER